MLKGDPKVNTRPPQKPDNDAQATDILLRTAAKMQRWGITVTYLAKHLGVSRQYAWQVIHHQTPVSNAKAREVEAAVDGIVAQQSHVRNFGDRMRAARISKGLTLKDVAKRIGYSWVGVERWEKNVCLPKPGVLWHLRSLYQVDEHWMPQHESGPKAEGTNRWDGVIEERRVA